MPPRKRSDWTVLSLWEPYASSVFFLPNPKFIENRAWTTDYRGRLYIHASGKPAVASPTVENRCPFGRWMSGLIIGSVELVDIIENRDRNTKRLKPFDKVQSLVLRNAPDPMKPLSRQQEDDINWDASYLWVFADPTPLPEPILAAGKQRLWTF